jgi:two-component system KDP operon response regulator KdpE
LGDSIVVIGDVEVDLASRVTRKAGTDVHLTPIEFRLLAYLCAHAGKVLTHRQIVKEVWGPSHIEQTHYPRIFMQHLRQKLEDDPAQPGHLITETGVGYRLVL